MFILIMVCLINLEIAHIYSFVPRMNMRGFEPPEQAIKRHNNYFYNKCNKRVQMSKGKVYDRNLDPNVTYQEYILNQNPGLAEICDWRRWDNLSNDVIQKSRCSNDCNEAVVILEYGFVF